MTNRKRALAWYMDDEGDVNALEAMLDAVEALGVREGAALAWMHANDDEHDPNACPICAAEREGIVGPAIPIYLAALPDAPEREGA